LDDQRFEPPGQIGGIGLPGDGYVIQAEIGELFNIDVGVVAGNEPVGFEALQASRTRTGRESHVLRKLGDRLAALLRERAQDLHVQPVDLAPASTRAVVWLLAHLFALPESFAVITAENHDLFGEILPAAA